MVYTEPNFNQIVHAEFYSVKDYSINTLCCINEKHCNTKCSFIFTLNVSTAVPLIEQIIPLTTTNILGFVEQNKAYLFRANNRCIYV